MFKNCKRCSKEFKKPINESKKNWNERHIYCSKACMYPKKVIRNCENCSKGFSARGKRKNEVKFCTKMCQTKFYTGKPNTSNTKFQKGHQPTNGFKKGISPFNKGKKESEKQKLEKSIKMKELWKNEEYRKNMSEKHKGKVKEKTSNWQGGKVSKKCLYCNINYLVFNYRKDESKYCSRKCLASSKTGELSKNWKGGISSEDKKIRGGEEYNVWRKSVYARDQWTCKHCFKKQKHPVAHHIKTFKEYPDLRFDVSNGLTLCTSCHKKVHSDVGISTRFNKKLLSIT